MAIFHELSDEKFPTTFEAYSAHIKGVLSNRGCPVDQIDDLTQDVWTKVWMKREQYDPSRGPLKSWLAAVAQQVWFKHYNKTADDPEIISLSQLADHGDQVMEEGNFYPAVESHENLVNLQTDLAKVLKPAELALLNLDVEGLTHEEIGAKLGISSAAVRSRLARMRDKLRAQGIYNHEANG